MNIIKKLHEPPYSLNYATISYMTNISVPALKSYYNGKRNPPIEVIHKLKHLCDRIDTWRWDYDDTSQGSN